MSFVNLQGNTLDQFCNVLLEQKAFDLKEVEDMLLKREYKKLGRCAILHDYIRCWSKGTGFWSNHSPSSIGAQPDKVTARISNMESL